MDNFEIINYENDWGFFVDIENDNCNNFNNQLNNQLNNHYIISVDDCKNAKYEKQNKCSKIASIVYTNLLVCGFLAYVIYFVL